MSDPMLIVTNAGLAAASVATPTGPFIYIKKFRVGSAYGYEPKKEHTNINGALLYEGVPYSYKYVGDNTLDVICKIPADAGPFEFGEVAIDIDGPVMFAKAVWPTPQKKYSSLGTNVLSTYTFHCLLKLEQAVAVFKVDTLMNEPPMIWEVDLWADVYPPALSANPDIPMILVRELDQNGNSTLIHQADDSQWTIGSNYKLDNRVNVGGGTANYVSVSQSDLSGNVLSTTPREFLVAMQDGYIRSCSSVTLVGGFYRFNVIDPLPASPATGSKVMIYTNRPPIGPTKLVMAGDVKGEAVIQGGTATLTAVVNKGAVSGRSAVFDTPGTYSFTVPANVMDLYIDGCAAGGGGGGAGGGWNVDHAPNEEYRAGGGGGGGGAGQGVAGAHLAVTPGEIITIVIGAKGLGGTGGNAPGNNGANGTNGGNTSVTAVSGNVTLTGGTGGKGGDGYGAPSGLYGGGGAPGVPGGFYGSDGAFGGAGGNGGPSSFGAPGYGGRAATIGSVPGGNATGNGAGGGGGGGCYQLTSTIKGGNGGNGSDGFIRLTW